MPRSWRGTSERRRSGRRSTVPPVARRSRSGGLSVRVTIVGEPRAQGLVGDVELSAGLLPQITGDEAPRAPLSPALQDEVVELATEEKVCQAPGRSSHFRNYIPVSGTVSTVTGRGIVKAGDCSYPVDMALAARQLSGESVEANVRHIVRALMGLNDTSPAELAKVLGIGRSSLSERMTGKRRFTIAEVYDMAAFFKVKPGLFFRNPDEVTAALVSDSGYRHDAAALESPNLRAVPSPSNPHLSPPKSPLVSTV